MNQSTNRAAFALPNFIIAGGPKSGTSSMFQWIADHPDALGSTVKETYFFVDPGTHMYRPDCNVTTGLTSYTRYFPIKSEYRPKVILESTPSYIYSETALRSIPMLDTKPKCLFILREPSAQIYSLFNYFKNNWSWIPSDLSFADYVSEIRRGNPDFRGNELAENALQFGCYVDYLVKWRRALGNDRILVRSFDNLRKDEASMTRAVAAWVGLDPAFYDSYTFPLENETYAVRNRRLQWLNILVRAHLPRGAIYRAGRSLYRRLNTTKPSRPSAEDQAVIDTLRGEFAAANQRLSDAFDIDLASWAT